MPAPLTHYWYWKKKLPERNGQLCRVLIRASRMNSVLVQFGDGHTVVTGRYAVRETRGRWSKNLRGSLPSCWLFKCCGVQQAAIPWWPLATCCECKHEWVRPRAGKILEVKLG